MWGNSHRLAQVLHGCRQLVPWGVCLSAVTSATLALSCYINGGHSKGTAGDESEEGGDDVKSSWSLCPGLHTCYNAGYRGKRSREMEQIPENPAQFRLQAATRLHEAGIASNRGSATPRWIRSLVLYTPPVTPPKSLISEGLIRA